jgi:hypothetical protein
MVSLRRGFAVLIVSAAVNSGAGVFSPLDAMAADGVDQASPPAKLQSDEALRKGMSTIRDLAVANQSLITHRRLPVAAAGRFAADIRAAAADIRANARLDPEASLEIDRLLSRIVAAADAVAETNKSLDPIDAIFEIDDALEAYASRFEHADWRPLR